MRDILADHARLSAAGAPFGRAVVTSVWGSAPRPEGACLLASIDGAIAGSVSGGCVESATAMEITEAIGRGAPKLVTFGVTDETAWEVGLACGGTIKVLVEPGVRPEVIEAAQSAGGVVIATVIEGSEPLGTALVVKDDGSVAGPLPPVGADGEVATAGARELDSVRDEVAAAARDTLRGQVSRTVRVPLPAGGELAVFLEAFPRQPKLVIFGGVHIAVALVPLARALGYHTVVADGREAFLSRERFPEADELILAWPEEAFGRIGLDRATFVCILSHDPKFDEPALDLALRSDAAYVGAIGSRKTQEGRRKRLRESGITDAQLARLRGPIGLDLGGRQPAETALAILAEMTTVRYGGTGQGLTGRGPSPTPRLSL